MGRKRASESSAEPKTEQSAEAAAPQPEVNGAQPITKKIDMVRAALADGIEKPEEGIAFIKAKFGIEMTNTQFSVTKSNLRKKEAEGGKKRGRKPRATKAEAPPVATPAKKAAGGDIVDAMENIKSLVHQLGVAQVKRIADLFG